MNLYLTNHSLHMHIRAKASLMHVQNHLHYLHLVLARQHVVWPHAYVLVQSKTSCFDNLVCIDVYVLKMNNQLIIYSVLNGMEAAMFSCRQPQVKASSCFLDMDPPQRLQELQLLNKIPFQYNSARYNPGQLGKKHNKRSSLAIQIMQWDLNYLESIEGIIQQLTGRLEA